MNNAHSAMLLALALVTASCGDMKHFDKAAWDSGAGKYGDQTPRIYMVDAARAAGVKPGATRDQIHELLGAPDSGGVEADIWYLGQDTVSVDYRRLRVVYDRAGVVTDVQELIK